MIAYLSYIILHVPFPSLLKKILLEILNTLIINVNAEYNSK